MSAPAGTKWKFELRRGDKLVLWSYQTLTLDPGDNVLRLTADEGRENLTATVTAPKGVAAGV